MPNYPYDELGTPLDTTNLERLNNNYDQIQADIQSADSSSQQRDNAITNDYNSKLAAQKTEYTGRLDAQRTEYNGKFTQQQADYNGKFQVQSNDYTSRINQQRRELDQKNIQQDSRIDGIVGEIQGDVLSGLVDSAKLVWVEPVEQFSSLETVYPDALIGFTSMTRDTGKVYRFNGTDWVEIQEIDATAINEVDTRVTNGLNTVQEDVKHIEMQPIFIETLASLGSFGTGVPSGVSTVSGGNYLLTVNGQLGDNFVTVVSGDISKAGATNRWAANIENGEDGFDGYQVTGTDGINKVFIYPNLRRNYSNKKLGNVHDQAEGVHYSEQGYKAFAEHIFGNAGYTSQRTSYVARFLGKDTTGPWVPNGGLNPTFPGMWYSRGMHPVDLSNSTGGVLTGDNDKSLTILTDAVGEGVSWEIPISKKNGFFEGDFGIFEGGTVTIDLFLDDVLQESYLIEKPVRRIVFPFKFSEVLKVVVRSNVATNTTIRIGNCFVWDGYNIPENVFSDRNKTAVYLGDSWGMYHNQITPREIERRWRLKNPIATVTNRSKSGMTTKYAVAWFDEYVIQEKPDIVIIEYFTNDITYIIGANQGVATFVDPNGNTVEVDLTEDEYFENIRYMISTAIANGIQPIVVLPAVTAGAPQTQQHAIFSAKMQTGGSSIPLFAKFEDVKTATGSVNSLKADELETLTEFNTPLRIKTSHNGLIIQPRVKTFDGTFMQIKDNDGTIVFDLQKNQLVGLLLQSLELTGVFGEQGLKLPNGQLVDNLNVLKLKARAGKTVNHVEIGEGTNFIQARSPMKHFIATSLPTASFTEWGKTYWIQGASGVSDRLCICIKDATNNYVWKDLF